MSGIILALVVQTAGLLVFLSMTARRNARFEADIDRRITAMEAAVWDGDDDPDPGEDAPVDLGENVVAFARRAA